MLNQVISRVIKVTDWQNKHYPSPNFGATNLEGANRTIWVAHVDTNRKGPFSKDIDWSQQWADAQGV